MHWKQSLPIKAKIICQAKVDCSLFVYITHKFLCISVTEYQWHISFGVRRHCLSVRFDNLQEKLFFVLILCQQSVELFKQFNASFSAGSLTMHDSSWYLVKSRGADSAILLQLWPQIHARYCRIMNNSAQTHHNYQLYTHPQGFV